MSRLVDIPRVSLVALLAMAGPLVADPAPTRYKLAYQRGKELSDAGDWEGSRAAFREAYALEPRPINLFNIAQTYWHQNDLVHARELYKRYIAEAEPGAAYLPIATERLTEIELASVATPDSTTATTATDRPVRDPYPLAVIDRPPTLLAGMVEGAAGLTIVPRYVASSDGHIDTKYDPGNVVAAGVGLTGMMEARGELDLDLAHTRSSLASATAAVAIVDGTVTAAAAARVTYQLDTPGFYDARLAVPIRIRLSRQFAVISDDDLLVLGLDNGHPLMLRVPVGVAYQPLDGLYAWLSTRAIVADLRTPSLQALFASYDFAEIGISYSPVKSLDVVLDVRASNVSSDGSVIARLRL